jgi:GTP 3',8-cyclase
MRLSRGSTYGSRCASKVIRRSSRLRNVYNPAEAWNVILTTGPLGRKLVDRKGRIARKLRISVTDRCNFACLFCMPDKDKASWIPQEEMLSFDEIITVTRVLASLGIERIRVTGGEPLLRRNLGSLISSLLSLDGIRSIDMTTNGWDLERMAGTLRRSGLRGVTVSLHSLRRDRFAKISGADALPRVLRGIDKALDVGLGPVKINSVAIKDYNDDEILDLVDYARERNVPLRFIEFMPLDGLGIWRSDKVVSGKQIREIVSRKYPLLPDGRGTGETSSLWRFKDGKGELGLITPISEPFCDDCDRIRLTSDGKLLSCLFDTEFHDVRRILRERKSEEELVDFILQAVWKKPDGVGYMPWVKDGWEKPRNMNAIGG